MAKQVLITCDSCAKAVPAESIRKWWGLKNTGGDVPDMKFAPLCQRNLDEFKCHACSEACLVRVLTVFAESVDMKKVATSKAPEGLSFRSLFGGFPMMGDMGAADSIGYYKKPDPEEKEDEE